ncbi:unnamed protein product [Penicillium camemberti]|uniref:Str. FM013 n=1 Tax=Penicillium camemberti (strain FM 013) TaxID=1429867 RepID=A0A0G4NU15_PENC3|nr:unnamed protein product [Penicillium camemberti]
MKDLRAHYLLEGDDKPPIPPLYTCNSKHTSGYPCIHIIKEYEDEHKYLEPELFHQHWHLHRISAPPINPILLLQEPLQVRRRGRPRGARNFISQSTTQQAIQESTQDILSSPDPLTQDRSTRREPSAFEHVLSQEGGRGRGRRRGRGRGTSSGETASAEPTSTEEQGRGRGRGRGGKRARGVA